MPLGTRPVVTDAMPDPDVTSEPDSAGDEPEVADAVESTSSYETDEGVVFYDIDRPLAWIQAASAIRLDEMA